MSTLQATNIKNAGSATTNITLDTSGGVAFPQLTGIAKANGSSSITAAARGTDFSLITAGTSVNATSGTSVVFSGIPSGVKRVVMTLNVISLSGISNPRFRIGPSGGLATSGYNAMASIIQASVITAAATAGFDTNGTSTAASTYSGVVTFALVNSTNNIWSANGILSANGVGYHNILSGSVSLSGALSQVSLTTVNGTDTFDGGYVNILYEY